MSRVLPRFRKQLKFLLWGPTNTRLWKSPQFPLRGLPEHESQTNQVQVSGNDRMAGIIEDLEPHRFVASTRMPGLTHAEWNDEIKDYGGGDTKTS